jgi:hypothetical protein
MNVWRLMAHHDDPDTAVKWTRREDKIAIGWACTGILDDNMSPEEITAAIIRGWPESHNAGPGGKELWEFVHEMRIDDIVIVSNGKSRQMTTQVTSEYLWSDENDVPVYGGDYRHQRKIRILPYDPNEVWRIAGGMATGFSVRWTLVKCKNQVTNSDLRLR